MLTLIMMQFVCAITVADRGSPVSSLISLGFGRKVEEMQSSSQPHLFRVRSESPRGLV